MNDYFDELELGLRRAVRRRAHLPWYARARRFPVAHRGLAVVVAALVVALPTVGAVGAVSGWFSKGAPDLYYPASATSGLGKVLPKDGRLLPIRVADPDRGPPWGIRLVKTTRDETCIQVGRVEDGQIGALGIDGAWHDDHEFHEIKPNNQLADICGATDGAGNGFANESAHGAPASVDVPLYNSNGASETACRSPYEQPPGSLITRHGGKLPPALKESLKHIRQRWSGGTVCPAHAMRMVFAGLLGPDAKSITYRTPSGQTKTEQTVGGVGAYLIVFRETSKNCSFANGGSACQSGGGSDGEGGALQSPSAVTRVTYASGRTCELKPVLSQCPPVGWVAPKEQHLTSADVASPIRLTVSEGTRFCVNASQIGTFNGAVPCDHSVPKGDRFLYGRGPGQEAVLATISFVARRPVTSANSYYEWSIEAPGKNGGEGGPTQEDIRAGQRLTLSMFVGQNVTGRYRGTVAFVQSVDQSGTQPRPLSLSLKGAIVVGRFSFKLPLKR